jgi:hypothetical protein
VVVEVLVVVDVVVVPVGCGKNVIWNGAPNPDGRTAFTPFSVTLTFPGAPKETTTPPVRCTV